MSDPFHPYADLFAHPQGPGDSRPTALQIIRDNDLTNRWSDRVVLVTGGTSGLGLETARALFATGADVFITARDLQKGQDAIDGIRKSSEGSGKLEMIEMDMNSLDSVKEAAKAFLAKSSKLNILVNNAGGFKVWQILEIKLTNKFQRYHGHSRSTKDYRRLRTAIWS